MPNGTPSGFDNNKVFWTQTPCGGIQFVLFSFCGFLLAGSYTFLKIKFSADFTCGNVNESVKDKCFEAYKKLNQDHFAHSPIFVWFTYVSPVGLWILSALITLLIYRKVVRNGTGHQKWCCRYSLHLDVSYLSFLALRMILLLIFTTCYLLPIITKNWKVDSRYNCPVGVNKNSITCRDKSAVDREPVLKLFSLVNFIFYLSFCLFAISELFYCAYWKKAIRSQGVESANGGCARCSEFSKCLSISLEEGSNGTSGTRANAATPLLSSAPGQADNDERPNQVPPSDETDEARQNNILVCGAVGGIPDTSLLTISYLTLNDIDRLMKFLDTDSIVLKNWKDLAGKCGFTKEEKNAMGLANYGGGNPALNFFTKLKVMRPVTVGELISKCEEIERNDCVEFLKSKSLQESKNIDEIDVEIFEVLAGKLKEDERGLPCWKNLAVLFDFDQPEIKHIAHSIIIPNQYSPTKILFDKLQANKPDMLISSLIDKLNEIGRKDVVKELKKIIKNK